MNTTSSAGGTQATPLPVPSLVWGQPLPFVVALPDFEHGLTLALGPGTNAQGATTVAAMQYRVPPDLAARYRGQVRAAVQVVAVDQRTGQVHAAACVGPDEASAPFDPAALGRKAELGEPSIGGYLNVDLCALLGLPVQAASYRVFAWLDELLSPARTLALAEQPHRRPSRPMGENHPPTGLVAPLPAEQSHGTAAKLLVANGQVRGVWSGQPPGQAVVLLGLALDRRQVRWERLAAAGHPQAVGGIVAAAPQQFLGGASQPSAFVLSTGASLGSVLLR